MNKKTILQFIVFAAMTVAIACSPQKEETSSDKHDHHAEPAAAGDEWKEMDEFHMVMAESFHPYKDSANVEPAKAKAADMAASAGKWASAPLPEKVNNDEVKDKLQQLKAGTSSFVETVKSGDDKAIGESLTQLHDLFHTIQETWYGGGGHHEHH